MEQFGPEPLRRINAPYVFQVINSMALVVPINLFGLLDSGMIFPEDEHGIGIILELRQ
ncbi:hypothetical protein D3C85_1395400 [compost metagenome]